MSSLPFFERLAPAAPAADLVAEIEAWTKPGEVVLDLNGRGGWVARAAITEQRRAADFESWPLIRLLADVVLRPPDLRQIDSAAMAIANAPFSGSTIKRAIDAMYTSSCPRCGRPVTLEAMVWQPVPAASPAEASAKPAAKAARSRAAAKASASAAALTAGASVLPPYSYHPDESLRAVAREYRCSACHSQIGGPELRQADPTFGDLHLAESILPHGEIREAIRRRFPAPRPTHPLVDQLIDLHTPRQLLGLNAILNRIDNEDRVGAITGALRLAFLHAVILAGRASTGHRHPQLKIANGVLKLPPAHEWRELNPWQAFEVGLRLVKGFVQNLDNGAPRGVQARLGVDLAALETTTANVTVAETSPASLRRLGLHGERMAHSDSPSRVRLLLGQPPLRWTPERLAASYHGTGWVFGSAAASMLPYHGLFETPVKPTPAEEATELATSIARTLAVAAPALARSGRAAMLLDDSEPATLIAAALGGAAAGCRLADARLRRGGDDSAGIVHYIPPTGVIAPGPRTRANRPLPPVQGGAGDPGTVRPSGVFTPPEKLDEGPFRASVAEQNISETAVELLKARGEPATLDQLLGDLLIGLDKSGQLARLARTLRPTRADDGWAAWVAEDIVSGTPGASASPAAGGAAGGAASGAADGAANPAVSRATSRITGKDDGPDLGPVLMLLELIRGELDRPNHRRIRQIEPGQYWLASEDDRTAAAQPLADRVEWAVFSLLSSAGHLTERAAIERTASMFKGFDVPDGALIEACLSSYLSPSSTPEAVYPLDQLEARSADHDAVIATLAEVGHRLGMRVWIGKRQQTRKVQGRQLSAWLDQAEREVHLPLIAWAPEGELDRVDCAWYVRRKATFLFEVEWTAMFGEPVMVRHARYPADDKVVRFLVVPPDRAELVKFKLARSPLLRKAIVDRNWHFLKWNHLAEYASRSEITLAEMEPYLGLDAAADADGEQLPLFGSSGASE